MVKGRLKTRPAAPAELETFECGTVRTVQVGRFDLMPPAALRAMARRLKKGAPKYGENSWKRGGEKYRRATISHLLEHAASYLERGGQDNTDAIITNAAFLCHFEERRPFKSRRARR